MNASYFNAHSRKRRKSRGVALIEVTVGLGALIGISILLLKASLSATVAQRWTVIQGMTDSYMTRETAIAKRVPFADIVDLNSRWPLYPNAAVETVEIGRLPGGVPVMGTIRRTRIPDENNFWSADGVGTPESNPAKMEIWRLQSLLSYDLSNREYVKTRTVVRSR